MAYTDEQLKSTINYILKFFIPETTPFNAKQGEDFKKILSYLFNDLIIFQPDQFEFNKNNPHMQNTVKWVNENIKPFPDNFNIILTRSSSSICQFAGTTTVIYETRLINNNKSTYSELTDSDPLNSVNNSPNYLLRRSESISGNVRDMMQVLGSTSDSGSNSGTPKPQRPPAKLPLKAPANSHPIDIIITKKEIKANFFNTTPEKYLEYQNNPFSMSTVTAVDRNSFDGIFEMDQDTNPNDETTFSGYTPNNPT